MLRPILVKLTSCRSICSWLPLSLAFAVVLSASSSAPGASFYWTGATNDNWNLVTGLGTTNWSTTTGAINDPGGLPGSADVVNIFAFSAPDFNMELGTNFSISGLNFLSGQGSSTNAIVDGAGGFSLTLGSGGLTDSSNTGTVTISANVVLGASQTWNNFSSNALTISGVISGSSSNNLSTGGTGTIFLTNANTFSGGTSVLTGGLTLSGNGSILSTSGIALGAGTNLTLENTGTNLANRIADNTTITSKGGIITLNGNAAGTTETVGTLGVAVGASVVAVNGTGSSLVFGASGGSPIPSLNRTIGGTVNFVPGAGATINLPNAATPNGILGGWAVTGDAAGNNLNWATLDGSNNVVPYSAGSYTQLTADANGAITSGMTGTAQQNNNIQYNATGNNTPLITASTTINTLYMTGGSQPIATTNIVGGLPTQQGTTVNGHVINFSNGISFGNGQGSQANSQSPATAVTLTIGAGGIISSGVSANSIGYYNNKGNIPNMAFVGYLFGEYNTVPGTTTDIGQITVSTGVPDLVVYTASDGNLRLGSVIVDTPVTISGTTTANLTNASNIVTLTGTATTAGLAVGESVRNLTGLVGGVQKITGITDATHFTIATNANATSTGGTAVFGTSIGLTKSGPGLLDLSNGNTQTNKPNNLFTGKLTINEGIVLIGAAGQLGGGPAAADTLTFNGGGLRTYAGLSTTANQGWTVGTRGGSFAYSGGGTSTINNKITGVGGFTYYSRGIGGGNGMTIQLANNLAAGGGGNDDYLGTTSFLENPAQGGLGDTANNWGVIQWTQNNQVPANSAVVMDVVAQDDSFTVQPNNNNYVGGITTGSIPVGGAISVDINGRSDHFGSLAGSMNIRNFTAASTLTLGANNLSTTYNGSLYGAVTRTNGADTTIGVGAGTLVKVGTGTQTMNGNLNFTGPTNVNGGTLRINSTTNAGALTTDNISPINVGGAGTLAGSGRIAAPVTVNGGALAPSNFSGTSVTTLTVAGNLTLAGGSSLNYLFGAPSGTPFASFGVSDLVSVTGTGNVAINNGTTRVSINVNPLSGFGPGIYDLLDSSTSSGTFTTASNTNFLLPPNGALVYKIAPPGVSVANINGPGNIYTNASTNELVLVVQNNPSPPVIWTGAANDSTWNTTSIDWATDPAHAPTKYTDGASVTFDQTGTNTSITLAGATFKPSSLTFKNTSAVAYTFSNGTLADGTNGPTGVTKSQGGSVTFNNTNTFTGTTTITGGSITIGATGTYASPSISVSGSGASFQVLAGGTLSATSSLNLSSLGIATFSNGSQSLSAIVGDGTSILTLNNNTALTLTTGISGDNGQVNGNGSLAVNGATADVTLSGNNGYSGGTSVSSGILRAGSLTAFGTNPSLVISGAGTLDINGVALDGSVYTNVSAGGAGVGGNGAIVNNGADQDNALLNVTMTANTTFGGTNRWTIRPTGVLTSTLTGNGFDLTKTGANTVGIATTNALVTGVKNININQGTVVVADTSTIDNTVPGSIFLNPTGTLSIGNYASATGVVINKPIVMAGGTLQTDTNSASGNATVSIGISLNATGLINAQTGSTLTLNSAIANGTSSTAGVTYGSGGAGGTVLLGVASNYGGPTTLTGGTVRIANLNNTLPAATDLVINGGTLDLNGHNQQVASVTVTASGTVTDGVAAASTLTTPNVNVNAGVLSVTKNVTIDNSLPGSIFLNPTGTLSLGNYASTPGVVVSKPIVMAGGILQTDTTGTNGDASVTVPISLNATGNISAQSGSTLTLNSTITNGTSSTAGVTYGGSGTILLGAANNYGGPTTINGSTIRNNAGVNNVLPTATDLTLNGGALDLAGHNQQVASLGSLAGQGGTVTNSTASTTVTLTVNGSTDTQFSGDIVSGAGNIALVKSGSNRLGLSGQGTFTGGTTLVGPGSLAIGGAGSASAFDPMGAGPVTLSGGTLLLKGQYGVAAGLQANLYNNTPANVNNASPDYNTLSALTAHLNSLAPAVSVPTSTGGKANLDFSNNGYTDLNGTGGGQPFNQTGATTGNYGFSGNANYEAFFSGFINVTQVGQYTFSTTSDDGSVLFIDNNDTPIVNNNLYQGSTTKTGTVNFTTTGYHRIAVGFYQGTGGNGLLVQYTPPGGSITTIPNSALFTPGSSFSNNQSYNNNITVTADSTIDVSNSPNATLGPLSIGSNSLSLTGTSGSTLTMGATTLTGNATFDQAAGTTLVLGPVGETGTLRSITKTGLGTLRLPSPGSYTGGTTISAGTLQVTNTSGSATGTGTVVIAPTATLAGTGAVGPVQLNGHLSPGIGANGIGTITLGASSFAAASNLDYDLSSISYDSAHTGALTLGSSLNVNLNLLSGFTLGTYTLVSSTGITGSPSFVVSHSGPGDNANFNYLVSKQGTNIVLVVAGPQQTWLGNSSAIWNTTDVNWSPTTLNGGKYADNQFQEIFDDNGAANPSISIPADVSPLAVKFANTSAVTYTITSAGGAITGPATVVIQGPGTVNLMSSNSYSGGTNLLGGTLNIGNGGAVGLGTFTIAGGTIDNTGGATTLSSSDLVWAGSFTFVGTSDLSTGFGSVTLTATPTVTVATQFARLTIGGAIGDGGNGFGFTKDGPGDLVLLQQNTYTGTTTLANGNLILGFSATLGGGSAPLTVTGGALDLGGNTQSVGAVTMSAGAITNGSLVATSYAFNNPLDLDMPIVLGGTGATLTKTMAGTLTLDGANTFSGGLVISGGAVKTTVAGAQGSGPITINAAGTFAMGADISNAITLAGGTLGNSSGAGRTITGDITAAPATTSTITGFDPITGATGPFDIILTGTLHGSGNINVVVPAGFTNVDSSGFRLRGPTSTDYTGTITIGQAAKFEVLTTAQSGSPAGTGTIVLTGGTLGGNNQGSFSLVNVRNNFAGSTAFGNNVALAGTGSGVMNLLSQTTGGTTIPPAGSVFGFGSLRIGDGQNIVAASNQLAGQVLAFTSVTLTGGNATFTAHPVGNTSYTSDENILLGPITESAAGSGITANGAGTVTVTGASSYTGNTTVSNTGTLRFNVTSGTTTVGAAALATVTDSATLELSGNVSALADGTHRTNVLNNSTAAAGLHVTGTNQQVGGVDGTGTTRVEASSDLTANHIVQGALVIGGTDATHLGTVTIAASDDSGNPLAAAGSLALAGSLGSTAPLTTPGVLAGGAPSLAGLGGVPALGSVSLGGGTATVPEPSTLLLGLLGLAAVCRIVRRRRG